MPLDWIEVRIDGVDGGGLAPVGFASIDVLGADTLERLQMPDDLFRRGGRVR